MYKIDEFSYKCGVIDCFAEMVKAGVKKIALSHTEDDRNIRDKYLEFIEDITNKYDIKYYIEDDLLISDLFPLGMCKDKYLVILYKNDEDIKMYLDIKDDKTKAIKENNYDSSRLQIAYRFGHLLGYEDKSIKCYINENIEKE